MFRVTVEREPVEQVRFVWKRQIEDELVDEVIEAIKQILAEAELRKANNSGGEE